MMCSVALSILVTFVARAYAKDDSMHNLAVKLQTSGKLGDMLVDNLVDKLFKRAHKPLLPHHEDLDFTTLGKLGHVAIPAQSRGFIPLQPWPLFQNSPIWLPPLLHSSALNWIRGGIRGRCLAKASGGKSSDSSTGAKPQRESHIGSHDCSRNRGH